MTSPEERLSRAEDRIAYLEARFGVIWSRLSRAMVAALKCRAAIKAAHRRAERLSRMIQDDADAGG